jgi:hypothetical protein
VASPAPAPVATPAPAPTASPTGSGTVGLVWTNDKGANGSGLTQGVRLYDANGGLTQLNFNAQDDKKILDKGTAVDTGSDGVVAWGRWTDGQAKVNDASGSGKGNLATLHYFTFAGSPSLPVLGSFSAFASTAPTVTSGGNLVATGAVNGASGTVNVAFLAVAGGTASYRLSVPVPGQTFTLSGLALQTSTFGFSGVSAISSTGSGCLLLGCTGSLGNGVSVIGLVGGADASRVGVTYGFDSRIGNVSGVIVFKR